MKKLKFGKKGITLISLVITIIILLILAGVSISTVINGGLLEKAGESIAKTSQAQEKESVELAVISSQMEDVSSLDVTKTNLENALKSQFGNNVKFTVTDNGDGSFTIKFDYTDRMYYVDASGKVIENDNILRISTSDELKSFRDEVNRGNTYKGKYVYLTNDIYLDINEEWSPIGKYSTEATSITDSMNTCFSGTFDGKNHYISGININSTDKAQGLFGIVLNGTIQNLGIINSTINVNWNAGTLTGYLSNSTIKNSYSNANIQITGKNQKNIGGIARKCH